MSLFVPSKQIVVPIAVFACLMLASCGSGGGGGSSDRVDFSGGGIVNNVPLSLCGPDDTPETGIQGDSAPMTGFNCGLTMLSWVPGAGAVAGSGHCAFVRVNGPAPYTGTVIKAYSLADPSNPVETDEEPSLGGSESIRAMTTDERAILVAGDGVYDVSDCEDLVLKGEIQWPSNNAQSGAYVAATNSHEIAISHDAKIVYSGLGFASVDLADLDDPASWTVTNWVCEMNAQSGYRFQTDPLLCDSAPQGDYPRQYSHSSDDNLEGTRWYGANQAAGSTNDEPATLRIVDVSVPGEIKILDELTEFPGHSMNWWRTADGREFVIGANEDLTNASDSCAPYPRPTSLGNALEAYIAEVTGDQLRHVGIVTVDINRPENCDAATESGVAALITETALYNKHGAAFVMIEYGGAGLRIWDLRDAENPKEVAYFNTGNGHVHSGLFHYDDQRGLVLAAGSGGLQVYVMQPQTIEALGLPQPTDPDYPYM